MKIEIDITVIDQGQLVGLKPNNDVAKSWLARHLGADAGNWLGGIPYAHHGNADDIIAQAIEDGLVVEPEMNRVPLYSVRGPDIRGHERCYGFTINKTIAQSVKSGSPTRRMETDLMTPAQAATCCWTLPIKFNLRD